MFCLEPRAKSLADGTWKGVFRSFHHFIYVHLYLLKLACIKTDKIIRNFSFYRPTIALKCCLARLERNVDKNTLKIYIYLWTIFSRITDQPPNLCVYATYGKSQNVVN